MRPRGFTLVEMLVVMTISAILVAAAVPAFQWTIARNRISDATNQLLSHLEYARMEASRRGNAVSLCRTLDANLATPVCSSASTAGVDGNDWAVGWVVFEKVPPNLDAANVEAGDQVIFRQQAMGAMAAPGVRAMIHSNAAGGEFFAYLPRGTPGVIGSVATTFAVDYGTVLTPITGNRALASISLTSAARCIPISGLGALRVARTAAGVCL
ncbi:MAG: GspH/FimT family pseudopilin [Burkholderiaceae bacterium]